MNNKGFLISFEGIDKSGKSTQIDKLKKYLLNKGRSVSVIGSLQGTEIVELISNIVLNKKVDKVDKITELLLYEAARRELVVKKIKPALANGDIVILDRYIDSTLAYQGILRDIKICDIEYLNNLVVDGTLPDLTFLIQVESKKYVERVQNTDINELDKIEIDSMYEFEALNEGFKLISHLNDRIIPIEDGSIDAVFKQIISHLKFL